MLLILFKKKKKSSKNNRISILRKNSKISPTIEDSKGKFGFRISSKGLQNEQLEELKKCESSKIRKSSPTITSCRKSKLQIMEQSELSSKKKINNRKSIKYLEKSDRSETFAASDSFEIKKVKYKECKFNLIIEFDVMKNFKFYFPHNNSDFVCNQLKKTSIYNDKTNLSKNRKNKFKLQKLNFFFKLCQNKFFK